MACVSQTATTGPWPSGAEPIQGFLPGPNRNDSPAVVECSLPDWIQRTQIILEFGESKPFEPFDREAQKELDQTRPIETLLDEFAGLRSDNLDTLRSLELGPDDWGRTGVHPEFGSVGLAQQLATWVVHDLSHLAQIARTMARQYTEQVGPWKRYLPILGG